MEKEFESIIISTREFRANQKEYLDLVDNGNELIITRQGHAYKLTKCSGFYTEGLLLAKMSKMLERLREDIKADILKEMEAKNGRT